MPEPTRKLEKDAIMLERLAFYAEASNPERARDVLNSAARLSDVSPSGEESVRQRGLSVVILNLDHPDLIVPLVRQLREQREAFRRAGLAFEIVVGDTGSTDPDVLAAYARWRDDVVVMRGLSYHFSKCNNEAVQ